MKQKRPSWLGSSHLAIRQAIEVFVIAFNASFRTRVGMGESTPLGEYVTKEYVPRVSEYNSRYDAWLIPATRTRVEIANLKNAEDALLPVYGHLAHLLAENPLVTDADLITLGLPPRPTGERHPAPQSETLVAFRVALPAPGRVEVHFADSTGKHPGGKEEGQHGVEFLGGVFDSSVNAVEHKDLTIPAFATRSPHVFDFPDSDRGKRFFFSMRWENNRAEKGPWTAITYVIIP
jgi:hypothetical protein